MNEMVKWGANPSERTSLEKKSHLNGSKHSTRGAESGDTGAGGWIESASHLTKRISRWLLRRRRVVRAGVAGRVVGEVEEQGGD